MIHKYQVNQNSIIQNNAIHVIISTFLLLT